MANEGCSVREAVWPRDLEPARTLLRHYAAHLAGAGIAVEGYDEELEALARQWGPPNATLLLAVVEGAAAGCAAVHLLPGRRDAAEVKRMWVEPTARGHGCGEALLRAAIGWAETHGGRELLLDTVPAAMPAANRLYAAHGFEPCDRYNSNSVADVVFFRRRLSPLIPRADLL